MDPEPVGPNLDNRRPLDILMLMERYARGELSRQEHERIREELEEYGRDDSGRFPAGRCRLRT